MTTEDEVTRLRARLVAVERRSHMAMITLSVPVGPEVDALAEHQGEWTLVGVLLERDTPEA
jgi:hypothetical protein